MTAANFTRYARHARRYRASRVKTEAQARELAEQARQLICQDRKLGAGLDPARRK